MNDIDLIALEQIRLEVISALNEKYGRDKVQAVDDLGESITTRMILGEKIEGLADWMYDIVNDFSDMLATHPKLNIPVH